MQIQTNSLAAAIDTLTDARTMENMQDVNYFIDKIYANSSRSEHGKIIKNNTLSEMFSTLEASRDFLLFHDEIDSLKYTITQLEKALSLLKYELKFDESKSVDEKIKLNKARLQTLGKAENSKYTEFVKELENFFFSENEALVNFIDADKFGIHTYLYIVLGSTSEENKAKIKKKTSPVQTIN